MNENPNNDHPWIGIDAIILNEDKTKVLLIKRGSKAYHGYWGFVSGCVDWGEEIKETVVREAKEETNLDIEIIKQFHTYSDPKRDPRHHTVSVVFIAKAFGNLKAGDDAKQTHIFPLNKIPNLCFDHDQIIEDFKNNKH